MESTPFTVARIACEASACKQFVTDQLNYALAAFDISHQPEWDYPFGRLSHIVLLFIPCEARS
jgi:hypothetical protein